MWPLFFPHSAPKGGPNQNTLGLVDPGELAKNTENGCETCWFRLFCVCLGFGKTKYYAYTAFLLVQFAGQGGGKLEFVIAVSTQIMCGSLILKQRSLGLLAPELSPGISLAKYGFCHCYFVKMSHLDPILLFSPFQGKPQLLKTVPEEVHHQLNGEDILIAQDRNLGSGTRF